MSNTSLICLVLYWVFLIAGWFIEEFDSEPFLAAVFIILANSK